MSTFLFDKIIFGPVFSRRLGASLGINLLPNNSKLCNFNCIYCECGWTPGEGELEKKMHSRKSVQESLAEKLSDMKNSYEGLDVITFAGNGEPTLHPDFAEIIDDTIVLRNKYFPEAGIAVLSNATMLHNANIVEALKKVDQNILKLDSSNLETVNLINQPRIKFNINTLVKQLQQFEKNLIIQTLFCKGERNAKKFDNGSEAEVDAWLELIKEIKPKEVMIYTFARSAPKQNLEKIKPERLFEIGEKVESLGIPVRISE
ncbi:radical SAM protein [Bacteroidota bacterium]